MTPCPPIASYISTEAPDNLRWLAFFLRGKKHLPMIFTGSTREGVVGSAETWWREQQEKIERQKELSAERSERMRAARGSAKATEVATP